MTLQGSRLYPADMADSIPFSIHSDYEPAGDQPGAINALVQGLKDSKHNQTLLGVTGSGKTFTMAHVIERTQRPALILAHNKTLAAQLYSEMKGFFPNNAVEYFVSYYDYYQPEAYVPRSDLYIEKDASINEQIDRLRHSATRSLLERDDVIVVASVSCIYGIGSPESYAEMTIPLEVGATINQRELIAQLITLHYTRNNMTLNRGQFRVRGDVMDIFPSHLEDRAWRLSFFGDELEEITEFDPLTGETIRSLTKTKLYANSHYVTPRPTIEQSIKAIRAEMKERLRQLESLGKLVEAQRLEQRTQFDLEMMLETGSCKGIENYSRYLSGRKPGEPPPTLFEYLPKNALLFIDESHVTVPQIGAMYNGDKARKQNLVEYGFRLPSCRDNRPLKFDEWDAMRPDSIFVSATPAKWEIEQSDGQVVEQIIRPTGLVDPPCEIRPIASQVDDVIAECRDIADKGGRVLITTLTKRMAEDLTEYLGEAGLSVRYLHSDIDTLERVEIIRDLRNGVFDILVGINLLREGLDIPECMLVAILDADKEGFLRSNTSLVQTIGRAARNSESKVILYADVITDSMKNALDETERRREKQQAHNAEHGITPKTVIKKMVAVAELEKAADDAKEETTEDSTQPISVQIDQLRKEMLEAAANLEFEQAARLRDRVKTLEEKELGLLQTAS